MTDISLQTKKETSDKMKQAESLFKSFMKEQGLRCTTERIAVLRELYQSNTHLDADEIFISLKKKQVGISRATVYHTLNLLFKFNLVSKIDLGHKHAHYEKSYGATNHLHIICEKCGNIVEVSDCGVSELLEKVCSENGFELGSFTLQVFGKCAGDCVEESLKQK
ncbi:MAG: transcriptional repressor [Pelodictyon phaeoclathratiforme]